MAVHLVGALPGEVLRVPRGRSGETGGRGRGSEGRREEGGEAGVGEEGAAECAVCLEAFTSGNACRMFRGCRHVFHEACISEWFATGDFRCPMCRGAAM